MPLYKKALNFKPKDLDKMSAEECNELLLCFRYLSLRDDHNLPKNKIADHIVEITDWIETLNNRNLGKPK